LCMVSQSPYGVNHRLESRMREIRTYGSEGGAAGQPAVPTPISGCLLPTANCNSIRHLLGSVSALMSWHDLGFTKNSEAVSDSYPQAACGLPDQPDGKCY
ncbi:MAG: hypothetical protein ACLQPD_28615, partial [Desulfomonilaceae bacterium]